MSFCYSELLREQRQHFPVYNLLICEFWESINICARMSVQIWLASGSVGMAERPEENAKKKKKKSERNSKWLSGDWHIRGAGKVKYLEMEMNAEQEKSDNKMIVCSSYCPRERSMVRKSRTCPPIVQDVDTLSGTRVASLSWERWMEDRSYRSDKDYTIMKCEL